MTYGFLDTLTTPAVRAAQDANGVGGFWEEMEVDLPQDRFTEREAAFIAARDSFYMLASRRVWLGRISSIEAGPGASCGCWTTRPWASPNSPETASS